MNKQPHLMISAEDISPYVLLPGDPARVDIIGKYLKDFRILVTNREFRVGLGEYKNKKITVCSTGIGCPSTAIAIEELINARATYLIRVGTCGGAWRNDIAAGTLIIPTASVRDEGTTDEYIPKGFPAVANIDIVNALRNSAKTLESPAVLGINRTHDAFYGSQDEITKWGRYLLEERWQNIDTPIVSSDMETAALFVIASLREVKAGCILAANADPEPLKDRLSGKNQTVTTESTKDITNESVHNAILTALEAVRSL